LPWTVGAAAAFDHFAFHVDRFAEDSPLEEAVCCELVSKVKKSREELGSRFPGGFWMIPEP
jgi:hypothetical protein